MEILVGWNSVLPFNPEDIVGEVLGRKARRGFDPEIEKFECPYTHVPCTKRSKQLGTRPYPICSIWKGAKTNKDPAEDLIFVCPKRFYAIDFLKEVVDHCWPGTRPTNPVVAPEVQMAGFGNVDFVIADVDGDSIKQFLSIELQAIDITGSVFPAYQALLNSSELERKPTYGFNWDNVYKRYVTQLIRKGYFHHHWGSKIVAVIPEQVYRNIVTKASFMRTKDVHSSDVNIIFMAYRLETDPNRQGEFRPVLASVEGTSHSSLQQAILYKESRGRDDFIRQIKRSISRR